VPDTLDTSKNCRLAADIGGTFTDVALESSGVRYTAKVLTTPSAPELGILNGIARVLEISDKNYDDIDLFLHGTTLATNALIEKKGAKTALITTEGFRDTIEIGRESRFDQYDINLEKPDPIVPRNLRFTIPERMQVTGNVHSEIDLTDLESIVAKLKDEKIESVAIGLLHSYVNSAHEDILAQKLSAELPGVYISKSSVVCPEIREYERFLTTCANAYVQPIIASYLQRLRDNLNQIGLTCPMLLMTSGGGLTTLDKACEQPIRLVESGPAGGAILATEVGRKCGAENLLSFDMGGTTAKICLIDNFEPTKSRTFEVARTKRFMKGSGLPVRIPVIEMVEIGAGGGSIGHLDSMNRINVGPESATSEPGPACYGRGGSRPTVTDADIVLGKINPENFAGGRISLNPVLASKAIEEKIASPLDMDAVSGALGICEIVEENMANATRVHAIERGKELRTRTLIAFGGAAPLHAARLAEKLGIPNVVIPNSAGVGSAVGFLRAPIAYEVVRSRVVRLTHFDVASINALLAEMLDEAHEVVATAEPTASLEVRRSVYCRYAGQGHEIEIEIPDRDLQRPDVDLFRNQFEREYARLYSRVISGADIEILSWSVVVKAAAQHTDNMRIASDNISSGSAYAQCKTELYDPLLRKMVTSPVYWRFDLEAGSLVRGPAIIAENETSTIVTSSFNAQIDPNGYVLLTKKHLGVEIEQRQSKIL
jgi:N-methylhydantoinase A